jgi:hypothetical protein
MAPLPWDANSKRGLLRLEAILGLRKTKSVQDVVFFSLNFKGTFVKQLDSSCFSYSSQISEIGISTLDTRDIDIGNPKINTIHYVGTGATIRSPKPKSIFSTYIDITSYHPRQIERLLYGLFYVSETRDLVSLQFLRELPIHVSA